MKKNYDIYDDDFNELSGNYKDLVNQPTMGDAFAEAFSKAGSNPTPGPQSAIANAILNGMSAGFKGSENVIRQQKLEPLYKMVAENTARAAEIRAQVQEAKQNELAFKKFADIATPTVAAWAEQVKNGDPRSNITFTGLIDQLSRTVPQFNKYTADHWNTAKGFGLLLNKETGEHLKISADEIMQAIAPRAKEIYGDRWFEKFDGLSAGLAKDAAYGFNMQRQEDALGLEGKRADVNLKQAHAGVYQQQASQIKNEMANPEKPYNKEVASHNLGFIKEQRERYINNQALVATLNDLEGFITEANKKGQVGSNIGAVINRAKSKYWSGNNTEATLADMAKAAYFARVKEAGGSNPSTTEFTTVLETVPNVDKDYKAALDRLNFDREQALKQMYRYKKTEQGIRNSNYQGSPDDETIFKHDDEEFKTFSKDYDVKVKMVDKEGKQYEIPKSEMKDAENDGLKRL